jgi:pSer/pThr/pTyr-binding forkhead associated (FHA) protein
MSDLALFLVRVGFLAVIWIFVFSIISVIRADLFGQKVVSRVAEANAPVVVSAPVIPAAPLNNPAPTDTGGIPTLDLEGSEPQIIASKLSITAGARKGQELRLDRREISIGRADNADLVIRDEFASTHHAKLVLMNGDWLIQDLNSTNGTYVNGKRVGTPVTVKIGIPVQIGNTVFELRA